MKLRKLTFAIASLMIVTTGLYAQDLGDLYAQDLGDMDPWGEDLDGEHAGLFDESGRKSGHKLNRSQRLRALADLYRQGDAADRDRITQMVTAFLSEDFETDLEQRTKQLEKVEARVARLRDQLNKRTSSKDEIVGLQVKQLTMSWEGLGWNDTQPRHRAGHLRDIDMFTDQAVVAGVVPTLLVDGGAGLGTLPALVVDVARRGDADDLQFVTSRLVAQLKTAPLRAAGTGKSVNSVLWKLYEATRDTVSDQEYWQLLIEAGNEALDRTDDGHPANLLDTMAHLYHQIGDLDQAIKYQEQAVAGGPVPSEALLIRGDELHEFLKQLKEEKAEREK